MTQGIATRHAPSFSLIRAHFVAGLVGSLIFACALVAMALSIEGHFFQGHFLGLVHLCVLGWLLPIAIGAMHQLVPVVFEVPVRSERAAWGAFVLYLAGTAGLVGHMWWLFNGWGLAASATLVAAGVWVYAANLLATLARTRTRTLSGAYIVASLVWLLLAVSLGLALAVHLYAPWLRINHLQLLRVHAHAAGLGFFGLLVMGVAYRLLEMFLLSYGANEKPGWLAFLFMNIGIVLITAGLGAAHRLTTLVGAASVCAGVICFLEQVRRIYLRRTRRKGDAAWHLTFASFGYLAIVALLGALLAGVDIEAPAGDRLALAYGLLALPGFVGSVVVGQLYKILPFLVWLHRFAPYVGLKKIPSASEILPERWRQVQAILMQLGILVLAAGILLPHGPARILGASIFAASAVLATRNFAAILRSRP